VICHESPPLPTGPASENARADWSPMANNPTHKIIFNKRSIEIQINAAE
jgi:hypothetical protein